MNLAPDGTEGLLQVVPRPEFPTNLGGLCRKGWTSVELLHHPERLVVPLLRRSKGDSLAPATWDEALDFIASKIREIQSRRGRDAVGVFGGGGLTNEKAYLLGKFARVALKTSAIEYNGRFCMSSAAVAATKAFGLDRGLPFPLSDIPLAEAVLMIGANPVETMPPLLQWFDRQRDAGGKFLVADPRKTPTAELADVHLQLTPGTDAALLNGLLHLCLREGYVDLEYISARTTGFEAVRTGLAAYWPERVERITGVPVRLLHHAAAILGTAKPSLCLTARGTDQQSQGVINTLAAINLMLALGQVGVPGGGWGCITGQGNGQGGREMGQKADQLPGYRLLSDPGDREHVARVWGVRPEELPAPGVSAYELLDRAGTDEGVQGLLVFGSNLVVSAPRVGHIEERLRSLECLVVADFFLSETAQIADVVLPVAQWAEEDGTMTNLEGRVIRRRKSASTPEGVKTDAEVLVALAERLGEGERFPSAEPQAIFAELRRATAGAKADYSGITYEKIDTQDGVFWPCPGESHPGTPRMFAERFANHDGLARFFPTPHAAPAEEPDHDYPLFLTTGRVLAQYQSGTQTRRVASLSDAASSAFVELHPSLASVHGLEDGELVKVVTRRGEMEASVRLSRGIRPDTIFVPFHFAGNGRVNLLTNPALDPTSKMPEFKVCAARLDIITK
jgi:assimilatory nitrate reductase catalytic subunit